ncbi:ecto-ADP-ribosyltransferase 5-like [Ranitomeya variabilis]|uniref:ecto-ADP-ribosyltransferase 5-like n=1 Tax=Ranitomeya variabilis TaxID=490064 RepID=UPI00405754E3
MLLFTSAIIWLITACHCPQVYSENYVMTQDPNVFDDQYIGCSDQLLKKVMPKVLQKEKENVQFKEAWTIATEWWYDVKNELDLPEGFEDEYGIALLTFSNKYPAGNPIYQQLNGNLTIAGASTTEYMEKFHFKALHFYLTRALQILKPNCEETYTTYRGSPHSKDIKPLFKFGTFTSSSLNLEAAQVFGTESLFQITSCFGAKIGKFSFYSLKDEVLIPPTEKFLSLTKQNSLHILKSTGEMCSYFNCAYLKGEKRKSPLCRSATTQTLEESIDGSEPVDASERELEQRMRVLEEQISQNHLYWNEYHSDMETILHHFSDHGNKSTLYNSLKKLAARIKDLRDVTLSIGNQLKVVMKNEGKVIRLVSLHQSLFEEIKKDLSNQRASLQFLSTCVIAFAITSATLLVYKLFM